MAVGCYSDAEKVFILHGVEVFKFVKILPVYHCNGVLKTRSFHRLIFGMMDALEANTDL